MRHANKALAAAVLPIVLSMLYVGLYLAMLDGVTSRNIAATDERPLGGLMFVPHYRFGGRTAELFFNPIFQLDKKLRPRKWERIGEVKWFEPLDPKGSP